MSFLQKGQLGAKKVNTVTLSLSVALDSSLPSVVFSENAGAGFPTMASAGVGGGAVSLAATRVCRTGMVTTGLVGSSVRIVTLRPVSGTVKSAGHSTSIVNSLPGVFSVTVTLSFSSSVLVSTILAG